MVGTRCFLCGICVVMIAEPAGSLYINEALRNKTNKFWSFKSVGDPGDERDFDDGLVVTSGRNAVGEGEISFGKARKDGFEIATMWENCKTLLNYSPHSIDSVASMHHNFLFVDNVKAGSTSVRQVLEAQLSSSWCQTDIPDVTGTGVCFCPHGACRTTSRDFPDTSGLFKFSLVRDPVAKFESGVRQAYVHDPDHFSGRTADSILDEVISTGEFTNEHLQPSSYRLSASDVNSSPIKLDYIGVLEHIETDWPNIVDGMQGLSSAEAIRLKTSLKQENTKEHDPKSRLSEAGIRRLCKSSLYYHEWACFGYEMPQACK